MRPGLTNHLAIRCCKNVKSLFSFGKKDEIDVRKEYYYLNQLAAFPFCLY